MAKITVASNYSLNMSDFDFSTIYYGTSYVQTGTLFRVSYSNGVLEEFRGTELTYNAFGEPITGTITSYAAWYNGQQLFKVEGSIAVTKIVAAAQTVDTGDDLGVIIEVLKGNDTITGGNIADVLFGFDGNGGNDLLYGYAGNDTVIGGTGGDRIDGGAGSDTASYATASAGVTASLAAALSNTNDAKGDTYYYIENLLGSRYGDTLAGNSGANSLTGGDGKRYADWGCRCRQALWWQRNRYRFLCQCRCGCNRKPQQYGRQHRRCERRSLFVDREPDRIEVRRSTLRQHGCKQPHRRCWQRPHQCQRGQRLDLRRDWR
ncbi:hypothetical protein ABIA13_005572 [Sinorhizobium fredii]